MGAPKGPRTLFCLSGGAGRVAYRGELLAGSLLLHSDDQRVGEADDRGDLAAIECY